MTSDAWQVVLLAAIGAVVTIASPVIAFLLARVAGQQEKVVADVAEVHRIVNSSESEMKARLAELNERLVILSQINATQEEAARTLALIAARAEQPPHPAPLPVEIVEPGIPK